ncbi:MAG TPA: tRNA lysidine(34) synthetase TilS [Gammaproteobacteria bacterium]|nr:tRNA lysidine(34) synthetase TilS [Gammaproteobacteria bacterium]
MSADRAFDPESLLETFQSLPIVTGYCVALSGGADSVALLVALVELRPRLAKSLRAIHVHHGLQQEADGWTTFCEQLCRDQDVPLEVRRIDVKQQRGESLEAAARRERYDALAASLHSDEVLLTAHHCDDQVETLLLHLLKGAGTDGLAAMPVKRPFYQGLLLRPLLQYRRSQLIAFLESRNLRWIDDPSNQDTSFDRNYLRHNIIPGLTSRWPGAVSCMFRSAELQSSQRQLSDDLASIDLASTADPLTGALASPKLLSLGDERRLNLLRFWLRHHQPSIRLSRKQLQTLDHQIRVSEGKGGFLFQVDGNNIRQFQGRLFKDRLGKSPELAVTIWRLDRPLVIEALNLWLEPSQLFRAIPRLKSTDMLKVRARQGGEMLEIPGRGHRSLKRLLQEWGVPEWKRSTLPLLWKDDRLICVPGYWVAATR